jgi:hypothetical protein
MIGSLMGRSGIRESAASLQTLPSTANTPGVARRNSRSIGRQLKNVKQGKRRESKTARKLPAKRSSFRWIWEPRFMAVDNRLMRFRGLKNEKTASGTMQVLGA